jgi:molecular chaperone GrpE
MSMNSSYTSDQHGCSDGCSDETSSSTAPVSNCCQEFEKLKKSYAYVCADLDNLRRRAERDCSARVAANSVSLLKDIIAIIDDMTKLSDDIQHPALDIILRNIEKFLQQRQIVEVPTQGVFNPELHQEAIAQLPSPTPEQVGTIASTVQKGYTYQGNLLRPAQVVVYVEPS